jgi:hypothetical protein
MQGRDALCPATLIQEKAPLRFRSGAF